MGKVRIDIPAASLKSVGRALQRWSDTRDKDMQKVIREYTLRVEAGAKKRAPVNKHPKIRGGTLRRNIATQFGKNEGLVIAKADYSAFQEYGTGQRGSQSPITPPATYEYGSSLGIPAQPFMTPAYEEQREPFIREIKKVMRRI